MNERYERGLETLSRLDGGSAGVEGVIAALGDVAPDLSRYLVEFAGGDILSRPELGLREREVATLAALTAMGTAAPQLAVHVRAALNVGVTPREIVEVVMQMAVYAGFPAAVNALAVVRRIYDEEGVRP